MALTAQLYIHQRLALLEGRLNALRPHIARAHRTLELMRSSEDANERLRSAQVAAARAMADSLEAHERKLLTARRALSAELSDEI
ncbi:hypothetical protein HC891_01750 [Candidatus Gracilibacteria bacterium]|nr:hypothetical protein [Candidatus Gracilibacteria bacterium]